MFLIIKTSRLTPTNLCRTSSLHTFSKSNMMMHLTDQACMRRANPHLKNRSNLSRMMAMMIRRRKCPRDPQFKDLTHMRLPMLEYPLSHTSKDIKLRNLPLQSHPTSLLLTTSGIRNLKKTMKKTNGILANRPRRRRSTEL
jgi:hypothetical protein